VQRPDVTKPFGVSVRIWRNRLGISQEELGGRAGLHRTYICDIERGARNVSLESIDKLAGALEISVARLFSYEPSSGLPQSDAASPEDFVDILFVEDDPNDIEITRAALQGISNRLHVVRDGQEALDYLFGEGAYAGRRPVRPQLILLDLALPRVDGLEVLRRVKANPLTASLPVVVLTASDRERDLQISRRLGAQAYIVKPVGVPNLTQLAPQLSLRWGIFKPASPPAQLPRL
jgi:CheY-like chemotaxis protein